MKSVIGTFRQQKKEAMMRDRYRNVDTDNVPNNLAALANIYQYNKPAYDTMMSKDRENKKAMKERQEQAEWVVNSDSYLNIPWRVCQHKQLPKPSAAEELIMKELNRYRVKYYREVEFLNHPKTEYSYYRYDFYIPDILLVIEYDGLVHHSTKEQVKNDNEKTRYCQSEGIHLVRYNRMDYYIWRKGSGS